MQTLFRMNATIPMAVLSIFVMGTGHAFAQQVIFSDNFEMPALNAAWQPSSGDWHMADVQEMRIAPAEKGPHVLCSSRPGDMLLLVDIPDSLKATQINLSFSYYTHASGPSATIEAEFHKKGWKDGLRGKTWRTNLPVKKGQWSFFQKRLMIPKEGNVIYVTFSSGPPVGKVSKPVCFDTVVVTAFR